MQLLRTYLTIISSQKKLWAAIVATYTVFFAGSRVALPYIAALFIDRIAAINNETQLSDFTIFVFLLIGLHLAISIIGQIGVRTLIKAKRLGVAAVEGFAFSRLTLRGEAFYSNAFSGSLVAQFNRFSRSFIVIGDTIVVDFVSLGVEFFIPLVIIFLISPLIAAVYLGISCSLAISLVILHKKKLPHSQNVASQESLKTGLLADVVTNILSVKVFSARSTELDAYDNRLASWGAAFTKDLYFSNRIRMFKIVMWIIFEVATFWIVAQQAVSGQLSVANALAIVLYVGQLTRTLWNFGKVIERFESAIADADEMHQILQEPLEVTDVPEPLEATITHGAINFENVRFTYGETDAPSIFNAFSLHITAGQKVGLVGPSGGGKSTLFKVLLRFANLETGRVTIDGYDSAQLRQDDLRDAIAYVPQEPVLFHRTIRDNILYGLQIRQDVSEEQLQAVLRLAHVTEFIDELPLGLETMVGERGVKLSGGQKQRIAIARAMLKPAPILLLDEATSALDSKSEKLIIDALDALMQGRTTLVIAHRLSTVKSLDRIVVLDKGEIAEDGSHAELLAKNKTYADLWNYQTSDYLTQDSAQQVS